MAVPAVLMMVPFELLFLLSGLAVNCIQCILFVMIKPFTRNLYRRINRHLAGLLWIQLVWLVHWWAGIKVELYGDSEIFNTMGKEHALIVSNHRDIDWLVGWVIAQHAGCLGSSLAVMKKSSMFFPVIGWSMWFAEYLFLESNWAKDESTLKIKLYGMSALSVPSQTVLYWYYSSPVDVPDSKLSLGARVGLKRLEDFPVPLWLVLFVEGARFTPVKLLAAQEYAAANGLHVPRNVLVPRTKGFVASVSIMRSFVPAIYDTTIIIPRNQPSPTMMSILRGQSSVVHVHMKRRAMSELPQTDDEIAQWCKDLFVAKDALLDKHIAEGSFGGEVRSIGRPVKSLVVVILWSIILSYSTFRFFQWSQLLSTWKGVAITAIGLALVTVCMQIFLAYLQAEPSSTVKAARDQESLDRHLLN